MIVGEVQVCGGRKGQDQGFGEGGAYGLAYS